MDKQISTTFTKGHKVFLREMTTDDAEFIVKWRNDPAIQKWMFNQDKLTKEGHLSWFEKRENRIDYIICEAESSKPIGTVNYINIEENRAEAGKMLGDKNYWGGGYAKEAFILWLNIGFNDLGFDHIYVKTMSHNKPNIGLNRKLGFEEKGRRIKEITGNQKIEELIMSINKEKFNYLR